LTTAVPKQFEIAVLAVYLLGGASKAVDTEDAALKCFELAPTLFSWQKHRDQINLELVRVLLSDAKKPKNGALLSGSGREGWRLSSGGLDWLRDRGNSLIPAAHEEIKRGRSKAGSIDSVRRERERTRLTTSDAWIAWTKGGNLSVKAAQEVFRVDEYTTGRMLEIKLARLRGMFEESDEVSSFLGDAARVLLGGKHE
jgi:hypothetical protein